MKNVIFIFIAFSFFLSRPLAAQLPSNIGHPSIDKVKVIYKPVSGSVTIQDNKPDIKVTGEAVLFLKNAAEVGRIYLRIINKTTNAIVYQADYAAGSQPVSNAQNIVVYRKSGNEIHITNPSAMSLDIYTYELQTEDGSNKLSPVFSTFQ